MATLLLIRHGQASFHGPVYDVLSETGHAQGQRLGRWVVSERRGFDAVFTGPLARQRDTVAAMRAGAAEAGGVLPDEVVLEELREYPAITLLKQGLPRLCEEDVELREWIGEARYDLEVLAHIPDFDRVFRRVQAAWMLGELMLEGVETFPAFKERVQRGLEHIAACVDVRRALVVTSGGPVGIAMQLALELSDHKAMRLSEVVANSAQTWLRRREDEWQVLGFNAVPHLGDASLLTYR
jgi:broad specificity phosphatase PhoE